MGYRSTSELPEYADVVVVGCGITGANAARFLTERGEMDVVVLEAREVCWGATGRVCMFCVPELLNHFHLYLWLRQVHCCYTFFGLEAEIL
jgi:glycine/D-amino acid oxidase-like deaminating enzyme